MRRPTHSFGKLVCITVRIRVSDRFRLVVELGLRIVLGLGLVLGYLTYALRAAVWLMWTYTYSSSRAQAVASMPGS